VRGVRREDTPFLTALNADETPAPTEYLTIVNTDVSFVYIAERDGTLPPVPAEDREGRPHDFSKSARLDGAELVELTGQGQYDQALLAAHTGIVNSPEAWAVTLAFLTRGTDAPAVAVSDGAELPATGGGSPFVPAALALAASVVLSGRSRRRRRPRRSA
jgi:hypothetical protein